MNTNVSFAARLLLFFGGLRRDLAHATRSLWRDRGFALVCVVSLGIGMSGFVALATFGRAIASPARGIDAAGLTEVLVLPQGPLRDKAGQWAIEEWSYPDLQALREADTGLAISGWATGDSEIGEKPADDAPARPRVRTLYVSSNYFSTLGVSLARGAGFEALDDTASAEARVVVNHDFWRSRMSSDPDAVGKTVTIDGVPHTVVGITPEDFHGHYHFLQVHLFQGPSSLLFLPLERHPRLREQPGLRHDRSADWVRLYGRLLPGVGMAQANARVSALMSDVARRHPATNEFKAATVAPYAPLGAARWPQSRLVLATLLGLAGLVLFVVCLNISGMMLVRGTTRERELSIRAALGADRRHLIQHLLFEALLLAFVAGSISTFVLFGIPAILGWRFGVPVPQEIDFDATSMAIAAGLCLAASLLFGLLPAVRFSRPDLVPALKEVAGGGRRTIHLHRIAALVQVGLAIPFLVIAGVMLDRVRTADFGFPTDGLAAVRVVVPAGEAREGDFAIRRVRDGLRQASGVRSVAVAEGMPIDFDYREFRVAPAGGDAPFVTAHVTRVGEDFLEAVGAPLLRGRTISAEDRLLASPVAVISAPLAERLFPGAEAIGRQVTAMLEENREQQFTVVGVSGDFATSQLTTVRPQILLPLPAALPASVQLIVRGAPGDEPKLRTALEGALRDLGVEAQPGVAFPGIVTGHDLQEKSLDDLVAESIAVAVAGGLVLVLATLGIVGVVGFMVVNRTREFAVRMALGSTRWRVFSLLLKDVARLVTPGVAGGLAVAAVLIRTMESVMGTPLTLGPDPLGVMEPVIYAGAAAIAIGAAILAGLPAARRATTVPPLVALRAE
jgi:predicted permease